MFLANYVKDNRAIVITILVVVVVLGFRKSFAI